MGGSALFGLLAAGLWGLGDFSGGMGVKAAGGGVAAAVRVVVISHLASLAVLLVLIRVRGDAFPHGWALVAGLLAGLAGGTSLTCFYMALSRGAMGASAAVSGLLAAAVPALVSMGVDGAPGWRRGLGFLVAGVAIWMIAAGEAEREDASAVGLAVAAGVGFGFYFVALKYAGVAGLLWPMATARMGSISTCAVILLGLWGRGGEARVTRQVVGWVLGTALMDTSGNLLFIAATRMGRLDVAAVLASLYPASTILLAAWVLREKPTRRQGMGMLVAVGAVVLITI